MNIDDVDMIEKIETLEDQIRDFEVLKRDIKAFLDHIRKEADFLLRTMK